MSSASQQNFLVYKFFSLLMFQNLQEKLFRNVADFVPDRFSPILDRFRPIFDRFRPIFDRFYSGLLILWEIILCYTQN